MQLVTAAVLAAAVVVGVSAASAAQAPTGQPSPTPAQGAPTTPSSPPAPAGAPPSQGAPPVVGVPAAPAAGPARAFTAPVGMLFNTVRPERAADFEKVVAYLQAALEKSTDPNVQAQARGWRMYKATEPGPNGTVLYVFVMDPTVPGADYGLGRIFADAYPDMPQLQEIWKLYTGAVTGGGNLLNLTPMMPTLSPADLAAPGSTPKPQSPPAPTIDINPNVPGARGR